MASEEIKILDPPNFVCPPKHVACSPHPGPNSHTPNIVAPTNKNITVHHIHFDNPNEINVTFASIKLHIVVVAHPSPPSSIPI